MIKYFVITFLFAQHVLAASCCGGGASFPSLITGDFYSQFTSSYSHSSVIGDVDTQNQAVFRHNSNREISETIKLDETLLIQNEIQAGVTVPIVSKTREMGSTKSQSTGLGDVSAQISYEFMPEIEFTEWKPRGFAFSKVTFPTAPSIYDFEKPLASDARGGGLYVFTLGTAFLKVRGRWDYSLMTEIHHGLNRTFSTSRGQTTVEPTLGASAFFGFGYSPKVDSPLRLGLALSPIYEGSKKINGQSTDTQFVWDTIASVNYLIEKEWSSSLTYVDQTVMGPVYNSSLSRTISLSLQKRLSL